MIFMVIETFHPGKVKECYKRFEEKGRILPDGVKYINSWIDSDIKKCYQVMEAENKDNIFEWIEKWDDLIDFEIIPVLTSAQAHEIVMK